MSRTTWPGRLNAGTSRPEDEDRRHLAQWLRSLEPLRTKDYGALCARSLLGKHGTSFQQGWGALGKALRHDPVAPSMIAKLEDLARVLEQEQAVALARLRGGS